MCSMGFADSVERIRTGEAIEEALLNAMYHGNLEVSGEQLAKVRSELDDHLLDKLVVERCREPHFRDRKILVVVDLTTTEARFVIRDEGRGFSAMFALEDEISDNIELARRRGVTLIRTLMDEVTYNETGNELVMLKRPRNPATDLVRV